MKLHLANNQETLSILRSSSEWHHVWTLFSINNIINWLWTWFLGWFLLDHSFLFDKLFGYAWLQRCHDLMSRILLVSGFTPSSVKLKILKLIVYFLKILWCFVDEGVKQLRITSFSGRANFSKHLKIIIIINIILLMVGLFMRHCLFEL